MPQTVTEPRANALKTPNVFWWVDLQAKDLQKATDFYSRTLGWDVQVNLDPDGNPMYNTAMLGSRKIAGMGSMMEEAVKSGMPSVWTNYVTVTDAAATCKRAAELGATVMFEPMQILEEGWLAVLIDPTGAAFGLWQPNNHTGTDSVNQPFTYTWVELYSSDIAKSKSFYADLFGWTAEVMEGADNYWVFAHEGRQFAGLMTKPEEMGPAPDCWITYFGVADVDASASEVVEAGGTVMWGPMQTGPGRTIGVVDPQGAISHFIQMDEWPAD